MTLIAICCLSMDSLDYLFARGESSASSAWPLKVKESFLTRNLSFLLKLNYNPLEALNEGFQWEICFPALAFTCLPKFLFAFVLAYLPNGPFCLILLLMKKEELEQVCINE